MNALRPVFQPSVAITVTEEMPPPARVSFPPVAPQSLGRQVGSLEFPAKTRYEPLSPRADASIAENVEQMVLTAGYQRLIGLVGTLGAVQWLEEFAEINPSEWIVQGDALLFLLDEVILPQASMERLEVLDWADECRAILRLILPPTVDVEEFIADSRQRAADAIALEELCLKAQECADAVFVGLEKVETELDRAANQSTSEINKEINELRLRRSEERAAEIASLTVVVDQMCDQTDSAIERRRAIDARTITVKREIDGLARTWEHV